MICKWIIKLLILQNVILIANTELIKCELEHLEEKEYFDGAIKKKMFEWQDDCEVFIGDLYIDDFSPETDFSNLKEITGSLRAINTNLKKLPKFTNLESINTASGKIGLVVLNNKNLRDIRGITNYLLKITGTLSPILINSNPLLDTSIYPSVIHKPTDFLVSLQPYGPRISMDFSEYLTLVTMITACITCFSLFLSVASFGSTNIYFVPGYHRI